jgi:Ca2+-binding RTX toxin-like protein
LDGGAGADVMRGLAGDDSYIVDDLGDTVDESGGGGFDTVQSSISFSIQTENGTNVLAGC